MHRRSLVPVISVVWTTVPGFPFGTARSPLDIQVPVAVVGCMIYFVSLNFAESNDGEPSSSVTRTFQQVPTAWVRKSAL